ncbi:BMC domain-containing protein [Clostridium sp. D53t1_180928_C8]|uniref:BMC domain-containing protein n=1 Tax=Clostridium sp. D53t1_180928_C8 TaxID=2787101 RepID=UPI0018AAE00C|nr:BMC domain-containing protein [Clostridium sp. D53t1_180928_C8]
MQAIGMIETKGLLASIEAADAMVKSANVNILEKVYIGGGYVSITITGDIGAVKSAVDAGVSAVNRLNEKSLVSHHVIARPHYDLESIIETTPAIDRKEKDSKQVIPEEIASEDSYDKGKLPIEEIDKIDKNLEEKSLVNMVEKAVNEVLQNEIIEDLEIESLDNEDNGEELEADLNKEEIDKMVDEKGLEEAIGLLNNLKISKVRKLVREYKELELTNKTISKMDKKTLISKLKENYKKK